MLVFEVWVNTYLDFSEVLKGVIRQMKKKGFLKTLSVALSASMLMSCVSFASLSATAVTVDSDTSIAVSASEGADSFSWDNASVYFLLTDRFKNGNTSNDHSYNRGLDQDGNVVTGIDDRATFHGGDFAGITQTIEDGYFDDLGVNALWISAPYEQLHGYVVGGDGSPSFAHYSYHGYYVLDYTNTDANFGTAEEFETMVDTAHEHGIRVVIDVVLNHAGYNSIYDMNEYGFGTVKSGWESSYFSHNNINNSTYHSFIDYDTSTSDWANWWGADWIRCGVAGYTAGGGDNYTMSLAGLPDFKTESTATVGIPKLLQTKWTKEGRLTQETNELSSYLSSHGKTQTVTNSISYWLSTWVRDYGVDGFRCDTAKHVEYSSWKTLKDTCVEALEEWRANNPDKPGADWDEDFWMTGECWDHNIGYGYDAYYTQGGFDSMINFQTQGGGLLSSSQISSIYDSYASAINTNDNFNQLSYLSSHDSTLARGDLIKTGSAFLLLPGAVQIYYGDETNRPYVSGIPNDGNGGAGHSLRSDMNWDSIDESVLAHWQKVGTFRNNHIAVGAGANTTLSSTSGSAFGRTYNKNGITDTVAGVIYASANTNVTIDVSSLWSDGQQLMNAYDQSSAVVSGGKVTFNSGANGTILIQEPDGRPLMTVSGNSKFKDSQTVTVKLENCDSAKCSIDGGNKFYVYDGTTFSIGSTAYAGDTVKITLEAENEKGSSTSTTTFLKVANDEDLTEPTTQPTEAQNSILYVKTWDGSAPYAYVWEGTSTALNGAWPGAQLTTKNSEGYYVLNLNTNQSTYNVVLNNGSGTQSTDITGLAGESYLEVTNSDYSVKKVSSGVVEPTEPTEDSVTIRVKPYSSSATYYLYVWADESNLAGAWPGLKLTEKDEDGNYIYVAENTASCNAIVNLGSGSGLTADITGLTGDVTIEVTSADCTSYKLTKNETPVSGMALLKKEAKEVKAMTSSDYTAASWAKVSSLMTSVDALIAQGDAADEASITSMTTQLQTAKAALVLATPKLTFAVSTSSTINGIAVPGAKVTVTSTNGKIYTAVADDVTGLFTVSTTYVLTTSGTVTVVTERNGLSSATYTYNMANGDIMSGEVPTSPTVPTTPSTQPTTEPTTQPATQPSTTAPVDNNLTVTATSNFFSSASTVVSKDAGTICVEFDLTSAMELVNAEWEISYDTTKLSLNTQKSDDFMPSISGDVSNIADGYVYGNCTNISNLYDFKTSKPLVKVYFDVVGTGSTVIDLKLITLGVGYVDGNGVTQYQTAVGNGVIRDITGVSGFEKSSFSQKTVITVGESGDVLYGDVNSDGKIDINDATTLQFALVDLIDLDATQTKAADVNFDGTLSVDDVTTIQLFLVGSIKEFA